ncbi:MAG TPA: hypothetical protein VGR65_02705 [Casimicrobiaceae bacterium]|jgi:hypothetical protein|nr:hypothetical protein [Casimicrobiaceae bacterium]
MVLPLAVASILFLGFAVWALFAALVHSGKADIDIELFEAGGIATAIGLLTMLATWYVLRGKVSANGVTVLPTWLIHAFGWFFFAGLLAVGFASDWGDPGWFLYLSFPVLLFGLGLAIARMHKSK